jgi:hypothetical protein
MSGRRGIGRSSPSGKIATFGQKQGDTTSDTTLFVQHINLPKELRPLPCSRDFFFGVILKELCLGSDPQNCISHRISAYWGPAPWPVREKTVMSTFVLPSSQKLANLYRSRPPGRSSQLELLRRHGPKMLGAIVCDRLHEMPAEKVEEGDMGRPHRSRQCRLEGPRRGGALLPREGQGWPVTARRRRAASKI